MALYNKRAPTKKTKKRRAEDECEAVDTSAETVVKKQSAPPQPVQPQQPSIQQMYPLINQMFPGRFGQ